MLAQASRASPRVASRREAAVRRAASASPAALSRPRQASARGAPQPLAATKQGGSAATQRYTYGEVDVTMPLAAVQQLPEAAQAAGVASIFAALGLGTWASCTLVGPAIADAAPGFMAFSRATWPLLGATFVAAGVAHFTAHDSFCTMMPKKCVSVPLQAVQQPFALDAGAMFRVAHLTRRLQGRVGPLVPAGQRQLSRQLDRRGGSRRRRRRAAGRAAAGCVSVSRAGAERRVWPLLAHVGGHPSERVHVHPQRAGPWACWRGDPCCRPRCALWPADLFAEHTVGPRAPAMKIVQARVSVYASKCES